MSRRTIYVGRVTVDSGSVLIVDPSYMRQDSALYTEESLMDDVIDATCQPLDSRGVTAPVGPVMQDLAIASSTGWGDGYYPVYAKLDPSGRVAALEVVFMPVAEMEVER